MGEKTEKNDIRQIFSSHPVISAAVFTVVGVGIKLLSLRFFTGLTASVTPTAALVVLTLFFHYVLDRNKINFLAKGTGTSGIIKGALWGLFVVFYPILFEIGAKSITIVYKGDFSLLALIDALCDGIYTALLIYGYSFCIIRLKKGIRIASVVFPLLFCFYIEYFRADYLLPLLRSGFNPFNVTIAVSILLLACMCDLLILVYGDVRCTASFLAVVFTSLEFMFRQWSMTFAGRTFTDPMQLFQILPSAILLILCDLLLFTQRNRRY